MGRAPCCTKVGLHRGPWTPREDKLLTKYIHSHGEGHWRSLPKKAGLLRCGKSCRLRWMNYLRPGIKRGNITPDEEDLIIRLHSLLGNRWSLIAGRLPGRTDNEIKNYWNTHLSRKLRRQGTDPKTHQKISPTAHKPEKDDNKLSHTTENMKNTKVHMPKAARVRTTVLSKNDPLSDVPYWSNLRGSYETHGVGAVDHDLIHGWDLDFPTSMVDNSLDKLYEEYLQLLSNSSKEEDQSAASFAEK